MDPFVSIQSLLEGLDLCIENNSFSFNKKIYKQVGGVGTGVKLAPPYACLAMGQFEDLAFNKSGEEKKLLELILLWKRFIDDIFFLFTGSEQELLHLFDAINKLHPTIKFTFEYSREKIHFLDTYVHIGTDMKLFTSLYSKPTDTFALLHFNSHHPTSAKSSIIYY